MTGGTCIFSFARFLCVSIASLSLAGGAAIAGEGTKWTAEDLRKRAVDHTFFSSGGKGDGKWKSLFYFRPDGKVLAKSWGKGWDVRVEGTWVIEDDFMCSEYENEDWGVGCYEYSDKGDKVITRGVSGTNKGTTFQIKIVGKGNVKNLE